MKAETAAARSRARQAIRYDGNGCLWMYHGDKKAYLIRSDLKDIKGDSMFELYENPPMDFENFDDWLPYVKGKRRSGSQHR